MRKEKLEIELSKLHKELELVERMTEIEACEYGNADSKSDLLDAIQYDINCCESELREIEDDEEGVDLFSVSLRTCALCV